ncbi:MAG: D-aminoacyl-tRNA deacylase [Candidatus Gracilibacteria bacterium]|nr:D-aminoacyl-tRNA deacylase [Candidatus Gracilibacteria bacterium]
MKIVLQRVDQASVSVDSEIIGRIDQGVLVYLGITHGDGEEQMEYVISKMLNLRIFDDPETGKSLDKSVLDLELEILVVSQFTLYGRVDQGRRPAFTDAAAIDEAKQTYEKFVEKLKTACELKVETGEFQAYMKVSSVNDGPFTLVIDSLQKSE